MVFHCSAYGCSNHQIPGRDIRFHRYPLKKQNLLDEWLKVIRRENFTPNKYTMICNAHFTENDYYKAGTRKLLKPDAIPSIFNYSERLKPEISTRKVLARNNTPATEISSVTENDDFQAPSLNLEAGKSTKKCMSTQTYVSAPSTLRRKIKILQQKLNRRYKKVRKMQDLLTFLGDSGYSGNSSDIASSTPSSVAATTSNAKDKISSETNTSQHKDDDDDVTIVESSDVVTDLCDDEQSLDVVHEESHVDPPADKDDSILCSLSSDDTTRKRDVFLLTPENFSKICRTCLKEKEVMNLLEHKYENRSFGEILEMCSNIKLEDDASFSQHICNDCYTELIRAYRFKKKCVKSQQILINFRDELEKSKKNVARDISKNLSLRVHDYEKMLGEDEVNVMIHQSSANSDLIKNLTKKRFYLLKGDLSGKQGKDYNLNVMEIDENNAKTLINENVQTAVSLKVGNTMSNLLKKRKKRIPVIMNTPNPNCSVIKKKKIYKKKNTAESKSKHKKIVVPGVCTVCSEPYNTMEEYRQHSTATKHYLNPHECKECGKIFPSEERLKSHSVVNHNGKRSNMCDKCGKCFTTRNSLISHLASHMKKGFVCRICRLSCATLKEILQHRKTMHTSVEKKHCCEFCGEFFAAHGSLRHHRNRVHLKLKPQICHLCGKGFLYKSILKKHMIAHASHEYHCRLCNMAFKTEPRYNLHMKYQHPGASKDATEDEEIQIMKCTHCNILCRNKQWQTLHTKLTHGVNICLYCDTLFETENELDLHHKSSHADVLDYSCRYCGKHFPESSRLITHLNKHRTKHYQCHFCHKKFGNSASLNMHMVVHTQEKMHTCNYCDKAFLYKSSVVIHERTHTGERPYICDICGRAFICISSYQKHRRTHILPPINVDNEAVKSIQNLT